MDSNVHEMEWFAGALRAWHLAILRYAVTLDNADRLAVHRIAREIDRLHPRQDGRADFEFFRRTRTELCAAIVQPNERPSALLQHYLGRIDDDRLKRTFAAAMLFPPFRSGAAHVVILGMVSLDRPISGQIEQ